MEYQSILFEVAQGVALLTLHRPDKRNSFAGAMHAELREAPDIVQADKWIRVRVITCAGRAFCAGQDLADTAFVCLCLLQLQPLHRGLGLHARLPGPCLPRTIWWPKR